MPANLNALIRYKTIDKCLSNPYREWTIRDLMEVCGLALKESRGIYTGVSERTIREDIRVMRSEILGFNAPIVQKDGNYSYEDRSYSIFNVSIHDSILLERVLNFILEIRSEVDHPAIEIIIKEIMEALPNRDLSKKTESLESPLPDYPLFANDIPEAEEESDMEVESGMPPSFLPGLTDEVEQKSADDELMEYSKSFEPDKEHLRFKIHKVDHMQSFSWARILKVI